MTEQNQRLRCDLQTPQNVMLVPGNKLIKRKLCQLQNKALFFEGQLNPLIGQNEKLKSQLTLLNKSVISSTDLLRSLLPIGSSESKRLKLQLANIEEISEMIKQDWCMMEDEIQKKSFTIDVLGKKMISNKDEYQAEFSRFKKETEELIEEKNNAIKETREKAQKAEEQLQTTKEKCQKQITQIKEHFKMRIDRAQKLQRQFQIYKKQVHSRYRDYEKSLERMKNDMSLSLAQFEESKKNLREIYDKLMTEKMEEQAEGFNILLKTKQEEKDRLLMYFQEKEQEMQKYLNQKSDIIQKLKEDERKHTEELQKRQSSIEEFKKTVTLLQGEIQSGQKQINLLKQSNTLIEQKLKTIELGFNEKEKRLQQQINEQNKRHTAIESQMNEKITKLKKDNMELNDQIQEKIQKLRQTEKSLVTAERRFNKKLEEEQQKWSAERLGFQQKALQLQSLIQQKESLIEQNLTLMSQLQIKNKSQLQNLQEKRLKQLQETKSQYEKQLTSLKQDTQKQFSWIKKQNDRILSEERIKNNMQMQKFQADLSTKLRLKEEQWNFIKGNLSQELNRRQLELKQKDQQIQNLEIKGLEAQRHIEDLKAEHLLAVTKIKTESQKMLSQLQKQSQEEKKKLQQEMVSQMLEFQAEMQKKTAEYQTTIQKIQSEMMNQINMLKSSNALQEMEAKFINQMADLKKQHEQQIVHMEEKQKESQQHLIDDQKRRIEELIQQYEQDMTRLAKKLQQDIQNLNNQLFVEQNDHAITKMTREEKIMYLSKKINELKIISQQKENQILQYQLEIQGYRKEQERMNQIIEERVNLRKTELQIEKKEFMRECELSIDKSKSQAQKKINEVEKDRLNHSKSMFEKFNQLKQLHQEELQRIQRKYFQLQRLFAQRPSRAQDLSKIKQLIEMKEKMDLQIKTYHKKVEHANQIVKYLNLELQNYKDSYDMFGPNEENGQKAIFIDAGSGQSPIQSIIKLKKMNQRLYTQGADTYSSVPKYETISPKIVNYRKNTDSPSIKEFQLYPGNNLNESQTLLPPQEIISESKLGYGRRNLQQQTRIKKGKSLDKSGEIVLNAENFLKLIKDNSKNNTPTIREFKSNERRAYRKSKPRRMNTLGLGNGEMYNLARRQSIDQDPLQR